LDLQQQRIEMAVGAELTNTATIITHTGIFDNLDDLYTTKTGETKSVETTSTESPGLTPPPPSPSESPSGPELAPESFKKGNNLKILLESDTMLENDSFIDLSKGRNFLGEIEGELNKLLGD
jgi:hypothetical protein